MTNTTTNKQPVSTSGSATSSTLLAAKDSKDFTLASPMIDVRGWDVVTAEGVKIGAVDRLMLDRSEHKPRYLSVTPVDQKGHMLLPVGVATLNQGAKQVRLDGLAPVTIKTLPILTSDVVTRDFERQLIGTLTGKPGTTTPDTQWYAGPMFDAAKLFGSKPAAQAS